MTTRTCPGCGGQGPAISESAERVPPSAGDESFQVLRCPGCGLGRTWPVISPAEIGRWYPEAYYGTENVRFNHAFELLTRWFRRRRARVLRGRVPRGPVLDIGCGRGVMLDHLRSLGYEAHGVELNEAAAWHARHRLGLDVHTDGLQNLSAAASRFQAVVFWHTLEHFPDPAEALAQACMVLRPGGLLALALPNFESLQARLFGRHWFHLDLPRHYCHFGPRSLKVLLARHSLRIVRSDHFCLEQNPFGWLQSLYNALRFPHNLLYDLLKAPSAKLGTAHNHPLACILVLALMPALLPLSLLLTILEAILRRGGTIEIYAVKD